MNYEEEYKRYKRIVEEDQEDTKAAKEKALLRRFTVLSWSAFTSAAILITTAIVLQAFSFAVILVELAGVSAVFSIVFGVAYGWYKDTIRERSRRGW